MPVHSISHTGDSTAYYAWCNTQINVLKNQAKLPIRQLPTIIFLSCNTAVAERPSLLTEVQRHLDLAAVAVVLDGRQEASVLLWQLVFGRSAQYHILIDG